MELIEKISRAIDPQAWDEVEFIRSRPLQMHTAEGWTRQMHAARQKANEAARRVMKVLDNERTQT